LKQSHKTLLLWLLLFFLFFTIWQLVNHEEQPQSVPFSQFMSDVRGGQVERVSIRPMANSGEYTYWVSGSEGSGRSRMVTIGIVGERITQELLEHDVSVKYLPSDQGGFWASVLITWLPMIFLLVIFIFFMRQLQSSGGKAMSFGKSRARLLNESQNKITFDDVAGIEEAKDDCEEIIAFLRDPKKFQSLGARIPKGVLLMGAPGTGKTLLARAIAGEAGVPFFSISGSDFVEMFVGVGASRVRDLFEQGKKHAPCIIFIDEIDAVGRHRGSGLGGGHDEREQTLNQLLVEMDGFESTDGVIIIAATNRPDVLDPAILRPGRFDRRITVPRPDVMGRAEILGVHTRAKAMDENVDLEIIARGTPGFSGADLENLINEAALLAARQDKTSIGMNDVELAKDKVLMGSERRSMVISEKERRTTAYHEAGHTVIGCLLTHHDPVHKVTIIPRGPALGMTMALPKEDRRSYSKDWVLDRIAMALGGRIAEEMVFDELTTGASDAFKKATELARSMVTEWGMSDALGTLAYAERQESGYLGVSTRQREYSEETAREIDNEVRCIIQGEYERATKVLTDNRDILDAIAEALLDRETLGAEEIDALVERRPMPPAIPMKIPTYAEKRRARKGKDSSNDSDRDPGGVFSPRPREVPTG